MGPRSSATVADAHLYAPLYSPWNGNGWFAEYYRLAAPYTLVSRERGWVIVSLALQALHLQGEIWECGVYKGGTARMLAQVIADSATSSKQLRLFDTFAGMPTTDSSRDRHASGDFSDTSLYNVRARVGHDSFVSYYPGLIPETFAGLEQAVISFAHVDVDIYQSVLDCCAFIYPRLIAGGFILFDDYGFPSCPGARQAVDMFFSQTPIIPLILPTGQAIVFNSPNAV